MIRNKKILKILAIVLIITILQFTIVERNIVFAEENTIENTTGNTVDNTTTENNLTNENTNTNTTPTMPQKKSIVALRSVINTSTYSYTGGQRNASVALYDGNKKLVVNKDYKLVYRNNVNPGKASLTITGIGNYTGTINKSYYIAPRKAKIKKVEFNATATKATITWRKEDKASGYRIYMATSKNGNYVRIRTIENKNITSYTKRGLDPTKEYYFKVRAYQQYGKERIVKKYSEPKTGGKLLSKITLTAKGSGANRKYNLKKACNTISGLVLDPGEMFNWFKVVGPASGSRGYKLASVFKAGKVSKGYGGGVCQVSSTIYQASKKAGLKIVERHIHSRPVTYTKLGNDATVSYGVQNLRIKNNKSYPVKIVTSASGESTTCKIYSLAD